MARKSNKSEDDLPEIPKTSRDGKDFWDPGFQNREVIREIGGEKFEKWFEEGEQMLQGGGSGQRPTPSPTPSSSAGGDMDVAAAIRELATAIRALTTD